MVQPLPLWHKSHTMYSNKHGSPTTCTHCEKGENSHITEVHNLATVHWCRWGFGKGYWSLKKF